MAEILGKIVLGVAGAATHLSKRDPDAHYSPRQIWRWTPEYWM